jgi:replication-associated recombination protein RarA
MELFADSIPLPDASPMAQAGFDFPVPLAEKYRPRRIADFIGIEKAKKIAANLVRRPMLGSAWFFLGKSGTGKTSLALAIANEMPAELHHIPAKECTLEAVQAVCQQCYFMPRMLDNFRPLPAHIVLIDEADQMSYPAQLALLSKLDATAFPPNTIFIFTGNDTANLEARFMSRVRVVEFSSYGIAGETSALLQRIWTAETQNAGTLPNFARMVKDSANNVRDALMNLEVEIMSA